MDKKMNVAMKNEKTDIITVDKVSVRFNLSKEKFNGLKEYIIKAIKGKLLFEEFWALKDVSFHVKSGEVLGILGLNGAGKSTLLKVISGVLEPTSGKVIVKGTIAPLIELGAGFDMELTARENIFLNGIILGYKKSFIQEKFKEIVDFAELWDFLDVPLKNYSSGMVARIAFSVATIVHPDILIVDEILGVGDFRFQEKCQKKIQEMMSGGTTVLFVSHSIEQIRNICSRAIILEHGKLIAQGDVNEVCDTYLSMY